MVHGDSATHRSDAAVRKHGPARCHHDAGMPRNNSPAPRNNSLLRNTTPAAPHDASPQQARPGLFVFFNSGPHSGASQPHRHIQLLPIAALHSDLDASTDWQLLAGNAPLSALPFTCFAERIASPDDAHAAYLRLYRRACDAVAAHAQQSSQHGVPVSCRNTPAPTVDSSPDSAPSELQPANSPTEIAKNSSCHDARCPSQANASGHGRRPPPRPESPRDKSNMAHAQPPSGPALISYNMAMTHEIMLLCPRLAQGAALPRPESCPAFRIPDSSGLVNSSAVSTASGSSAIGSRPDSPAATRTPATKTPDSSATGNPPAYPGKLALNGTLLAGTALVKSEADWVALRHDARLLRAVLSTIGVPNAAAREPL